MTRKCHVRFGGGRLEKARQRDLAGRLPYAWGSLAKRANELPKGTLVTVTGKQRLERYKSKDGDERTGTMIVLSAIDPA